MLEWLSGMTRNHMGITRNHINAYAWACWSGVVICVGVLEWCGYMRGRAGVLSEDH